MFQCHIESSKARGWASIAMICVVDPHESEAKCDTWTNILLDFNLYLIEIGVLNRIRTGFRSVVAIL